MWVALIPSAAGESIASRVFTAGKRASHKRCLITDSWHDANSALSTSCK